MTVSSIMMMMMKRSFYQDPDNNLYLFMNNDIHNILSQSLHYTFCSFRCVFWSKEYERLKTFLGSVVSLYFRWSVFLNKLIWYLMLLSEQYHLMLCFTEFAVHFRFTFRSFTIAKLSGHMKNLPYLPHIFFFVEPLWTTSIGPII